MGSAGQQLGGATCRLSCCLTLSFVPTPLSDTWILGFLNTWILGYLDTGILDTLGTRLQPPPGQRPATSLTTTALATTVKIRYYREDTKNPMIPDESASWPRLCLHSLSRHLDTLDLRLWPPPGYQPATSLIQLLHRLTMYCYYRELRRYW